MTKAGVVHSGDNPSNHSVIYAKFNVGQLNLQTEQIRVPKRTSWAAANEEAKLDYKTILDEKLGTHPTLECI